MTRELTVPTEPGAETGHIVIPGAEVLRYTITDYSRAGRVAGSMAVDSANEHRFSRSRRVLDGAKLLAALVYLSFRDKE